jgi:hypothetical protein
MMSYWGYKGISDPPSGCAGFISAVIGLMLAPVVLGAIGYGVGYLLGYLLGGVSAAPAVALLGIVVGVVLGLYNAVTMPGRVRKAKRMRDAYNRLYDRM